MKYIYRFRTKWFLLMGCMMLVCSVPIFASANLVAEAGLSAAAASGNYLIVDTDQVKCYDASSEIPCPSFNAAFYGQDAQSKVHTPSYTNNGNGTITDNVSGLIWQQSPDLNNDDRILKADKLTYTAAGTYCENLTLASYTDWRLPNIKQLYSLIEFSGTDPSGLSGTDTSGLTPFIDTNYFGFAYGDTSAGERTIDSQYASSTVYVATTATDGAQAIFGVNFADGRIKGYGSITPDGQTKTFFVQCVRGNTSYGINEFVDNGDQTITDSASNLMWTKADSGTAMNWQEALAWAQTRNAENYLGHSDWRLPEAKEMQGILDYSRSPDTTDSAAIDPIFNATSFTNEGGQTDWPWYWTSTTHASSNGMGGAGVYIAFGRAGGWQKATTSATCYTLYDVHGAGSQRSDPKISSGLITMGTACTGGTAYGNGPQGDVQRAANYVRLVRNANTISVTPTFTLYLPLITSFNSATITYPLVDTAQGTCYDNSELIDCPAEGEAFYGQDAQYKGNTPSYTDNGDGTVTDNVTSLVWTQDLSDVSMPWSGASDYCESLTVGSVTDRRLPNVKELWSIRDFSAGWPWVNTKYFHLVGDGSEGRQQHSWSSNYYLVHTNEAAKNVAFVVNDWTGHIKALDGNRYVRCVSGDEYGINDFVDNGDRTITDNATGLMWAQNDSGEAMDWEAALDYAEDATYAGYDDWRLPNVKELQSIADYSGVFPAIDSTIFNVSKITNEAGNADYPYFWTSTSNPYIDPHDVSGYWYAWYVAFGYAVDQNGNDTHGAGAVRFDTKSEDGAGGPDGERYYNYVRLVRGGDVVETPDVTPTPTQTPTRTSTPTQIPG